MILNNILQIVTKSYNMQDDFEYTSQSEAEHRLFLLNLQLAKYIEAMWLTDSSRMQVIYRQYYLVFSVSALVFGWGAQYLPEAEGRGQIRHRGQIQGGYWKHQVMLYLLHTWTVFVRFCL